MDTEKTFSNPETEKEGAWADYRDESKVKIARIGNPNFVRVHAARMKPYLRQQRNGTLDDELETKVLCDVLAETVLLDWEGFTTGGKALKYSKEAAKDLLAKHVDFRNEVVDLATTEEIFRDNLQEDSTKN